MPRLHVLHPNDPSGEALGWLRDRGVEVTTGTPLWKLPVHRLDEQGMIAAIHECDAVIGAGDGEAFSRRVIASAPRLRCIAMVGVGYDTVDLEAATDHGIAVTNTPEHADVEAVCEHAITLMLALRKRLLHWGPNLVRDGGWRDDTFGSLLRDSTIGIVGFGRIGRGVARRLTGWNVRLLAHDPYPGEPVSGVERVELDALLAESDTVTIHVAATASNHHLIDARRLSLMKPNAIIINTSRGSLIDQVALAEALSAGRVAGAGLDVLEKEPPDAHDPLLRSPNTIITPHVAAWTREVVNRVAWRAARNVWWSLTGEGTPDVVNPIVLDRLRAGGPVAGAHGGD
jgi:D-3-phosphoglycerate dehydrogenase